MFPTLAPCLGFEQPKCRSGRSATSCCVPGFAATNVMLTASMALASFPAALYFSLPCCRLACSLLFMFFSPLSPFSASGAMLLFPSQCLPGISQFPYSLFEKNAFTAVVSFGLCSLLLTLEEPKNRERGWQRNCRSLLSPQSMATSEVGQPYCRYPPNFITAFNISPGIPGGCAAVLGLLQRSSSADHGLSCLQTLQAATALVRHRVGMGSQSCLQRPVPVSGHPARLQCIQHLSFGVAGDRTWCARGAWGRLWLSMLPHGHWAFISTGF